MLGHQHILFFGKKFNPQCQQFLSNDFKEEDEVEIGKSYLKNFKFSQVTTEFDSLSKKIIVHISYRPITPKFKLCKGFLHASPSMRIFQSNIL